jgi:hypothetical protein
VRPPSILALAILALGASGTRAATLTVDVLRRGQPLEAANQGRVYIRPVGDARTRDLPPDAYLAWGLAGTPIRVPDGTYDVVVKYVNDRIEHVEAIEKLTLSGDVRRSVDFDAPIARLTLKVQNAGEPIPRFEGAYRLYRAGQRGRPVAAKRPGDTLTILPGTYDVEVVWRGPHGLERRWLNGYALREDQVETVDMRDDTTATAESELGGF